MKLLIERKVWIKGTAVVALSASLVAGCGSDSTSAPSASPTASAGAQATSAPQPIELSYWVALTAETAGVLKDYNESLFYQELEKKSKVHVNWQHPPVGSDKEQFNLMIASGKLPDVIEYNFSTYSGGPEKAIADKVIIPLNDVINKYAPNLKKYLDEHPQVKKDVSTDSGNMYVFPAIGIGNTNVTRGLMLRKDWLDELGLAVPETIDEWTQVLRQFKEKKGAAAPFTMELYSLTSDLFNGAYDIGVAFYQDNGKVKYGPYEPAYKDYLKQMNAWYKEGLIDQDFATQDGKAIDSKITNSQAGAVSGYISGTMSKYLTAMKTSNPKFDLVAAQHPVLKKGSEPKFFLAAYDYRGTGSAAITTANKHVAETAKWLDYLYSEEGNNLKTFGVEGKTYTMVNGQPIYTDLILKNPDGLTSSQARSKFLRVTSPAPGFVSDPRTVAALPSSSAMPQLSVATEVYNKYYKNVLQTRMPQITELPEEGQEMASIMAEVDTYRKEMFLKFVMGAESIDNFDKYIQQLKKMKIDRAIEIQQGALDRYNKRG